MNGSYTVPIGNSRVPNKGADRPRAASIQEQVVLGDAQLDVLARPLAAHFCADGILASL